jgi:enhancing lycopene biosynthesis protein 2
MASKKDFGAINTGRVYNSIEQATSRRGQQGQASPQEAAERAAELRTQGRMGCKAIRINMAFTPDNHQFIKVMAKISGKTMTEFTNLVIERYRTEHPELYEQAKAIIDQL